MADGTCVVIDGGLRCTRKVKYATRQWCGTHYERWRKNGDPLVTKPTPSKHGMTGTPEFNTWSHVIARCTNPRSKDFPRWGGRGITVCDEWRSSFLNFYRDMGPRPSPSHSIDRIDNDGAYEPGNCRWATQAEQQRNRRNNRWYTHEGETLTLAGWSERLGIPYFTLRTRLDQLGWTVDRALSTPVRRRRPTEANVSQ